MIERQNTFGDYQFPNWVPEHTQEIIRDFWGQMGRTYKDWIEDSGLVQGMKERCSHGPGPNGFGIPPTGATVFFFKQKNGTPYYEKLKGRYVHRWNNMGSLIDEEGNDHTVSSCDPWVRVYRDDEFQLL